MGQFGLGENLGRLFGDLVEQREVWFLWVKNLEDGKERIKKKKNWEIM